MRAACFLPGRGPFEARPSVAAEVTEIQKYGNLVLSVSCTDLMAAGFDWGDLVTLNVAGASCDMPLVSNYTDVDMGCMLLRAVRNEAEGTDLVLAALNFGNFAAATGVAVKASIEEEPGYRWDYLVETPVAVTVTVKEPGAYRAEYMLRQLSRSQERSDYPDLDDSAFANFRAVTTTGMGEGKLYRSSSPVNPGINRNTQAAAAMEAAGVRTVVNLADAESVMKGYEGYEGSHYSTLDVIALNLDIEYLQDRFKVGLAEGFRFIATHDAPYLVHCNEGKDRAGFTAAILECLMGASADEAVEDYMVTFYNYYGVEPGTERYRRIADANIVKVLCTVFGIDSLAGADLAAEAEEYLAGIGMSADEIAALKAALQ